MEVLLEQLKPKETILRVAIQGIVGSFHHQVAMEALDCPFDISECLSFDEVADALHHGDCDMAVMALENSIAGSILPNYALIDTYGFSISGEYYMNISQNLIALSGQRLADIKEVHSHPMALLQCMDFLKQHPHIRLVEDKDTAETARRIAQQQLEGIAAIGSHIAATLYKLEVLVPNIQTVDSNMTRFALLTRKPIVAPKTVNKASLKFELHHHKGSLASVLTMMRDYNLNLTKIQSLPIINTPWKYAFFVDVTFDSYSDFKEALEQIQKMAQQCRVLGEYKNEQR